MSAAVIIIRVDYPETAVRVPGEVVDAIHAVLRPYGGGEVKVFGGGVSGKTL